MNRPKRSRQYDDDSDTRARNKRHVSDDDVLVKVLVPATGTGFIIGKGGETIKKIQREMGASLDLSRENFPGSEERPGVIKGEKDNVRKMLDFIVETINEKLRGPSADISQSEIKLLVPDTTAGRIIGKAGSKIKKMISDSGCQIRIWNIQEDLPFPERMLIVRGDKAKLAKGLDLVYEAITSDSESKAFPSIDYGGGSRGQGGMQGGSMGGAGRDMGFSSQMDRSRGGGANFSNNPGLEGVKALLQNKGFNFSEAEEIGTSMSTLVDFGFFSQSSPPPVTMESMALLLLAGKGIGATNFSRQQSNFEGGNSGNFGQRNMGGDGYADRDFDSRGNTGGGSYGGSNGRGGRYEDGNMGSGSYDGGNTRSGQYGDGGVGGGSYDQRMDNYQSQRAGSYGMSSDRDRGVSNVTLEMDMEDSIISMVAGSRGSKLLELMDSTSTKISVSDQYVPGTRNRMITIRGSVTGTQRAFNVLQQQCNQTRQMYR